MHSQLPLPLMCDDCEKGFRAKEKEMLSCLGYYMFFQRKIICCEPSMTVFAVAEFTSLACCNSGLAALSLSYIKPNETWD